MRMRSKLVVFAVVVLLVSLPYARAQTDSEPESPTVVSELRREIVELKQRIAELEARLERMELQSRPDIQWQLPGRVIPNQWQKPDQGSYLRFPIDVERAMMGDAALPLRFKGRYNGGPPTITWPPFEGGSPLERLEPPQND